MKMLKDTKIIRFLIKHFSKEKKSYRQIQELIEIEGYTRPSIGFISKIPRKKKKTKRFL